jgi:hypothetical protein
MSWARRRQTLYGGGALIFFVLVVGLPLFFFFYTTPTCTDGIKNQKEVAIDRGGPCPLLADTQVQKEAILWTRAFKVADGVYNAVAYVDNPNFDAGISDIPYSLKLFDANNILVAERKGRTYILPNGITPVFEGGIETGERVPARAFFTFLEMPLWKRMEQTQGGLSIGTRILSNEDTLPRVDATIRNDSFEDIFDIEVVVTLFDSAGNAIHSSRTVLNLLASQSSQSVVFTWPEPFPAPISRIEIIPRSPFIMSK